MAKKFRPITIPIAIVLASAYFYYIINKAGVLKGTPPSYPGLQVKVKYVPESCNERTKNGDLVQLSYQVYRHSTGEKVTDTDDLPEKKVSVKLGHCKVARTQDTILCTNGVVKGLTNACIGEKRTLLLEPRATFGPRGFPDLNITGTDLLVMHTVIQDFDSFGSN